MARDPRADMVVQLTADPTEADSTVQLVGTIPADAYVPATFGAAGDGATDDTAALNALFAAAAADRQPVYLPADTYAVYGVVTIPDGVHVVSGAGQLVTVLSLKAAAATVVVSAQRAHLYDFSITGGSVATNGMVLRNASRSVFDCVRVQNCTGSAVLIESPVGGTDSNVAVRFVRCEFRGSNRGLEVADAAAVAGSTNVTLFECEIFANTAEGLLLRNNGHRIYGGVITNNGTGVKLGAAGDVLTCRGGLVLLPHLEGNTVYFDESIGLGWHVQLREGWGVSASAVQYVANGKNVLVTHTEAGLLSRSDEKYVAKTATEVVSNSVTLQSDDHLVLPVKAGQVWRIRYTLIYRSPTAAGMKVQPLVPGASTWISLINALHTNATTVAATARREVLTAGASVMGSAGAGVSTVADYELIVTAVADGDVVLQWAQNVLDAGNTSVLLGSYLLAKRLA